MFAPLLPVTGRCSRGDSSRPISLRPPRKCRTPLFSGTDACSVRARRLCGSLLGRALGLRGHAAADLQAPAGPIPVSAQLAHRRLSFRFLGPGTNHRSHPTGVTNDARAQCSKLVSTVNETDHDDHQQIISPVGRAKIELGRVVASTKPEIRNDRENQEVIGRPCQEFPWNGGNRAAVHCSCDVEAEGAIADRWPDGGLLVLLTEAVTNECTRAVAFHTTLALKAQSQPKI